MGLIERIRHALLNQKYELTLHAKEELEDDDLTIDDLKTSILRGKVIKKFTHDIRGTRYEILGPTLEGHHLKIVGRFLPTGEFRIITTFKI